MLSKAKLKLLDAYYSPGGLQLRGTRAMSVSVQVYTV
jgi:hypothetical protein